MINNVKYLPLIIITFLLCTVFNGNALGEEYNNRRKVIVGGDFDYKPFSYLDEKGEARGFDIDIVKAIAEKNNFDIEFKLTNWDEALKSLEMGEVDMLVSILFTENRNKIYDFTIPLTEEFYAIFARKNSDIDEISDLADKSIISLKGDASIEKFLKPMGFNENTTFINSLPLAISLLSQGEQDAVIVPYSIGVETMISEKIRNVEAVGPPIIPSLYRFAVKKGNSELLSILNDGIYYVKTTGISDELRKNWNFHKRGEAPVSKIMRYIAYFSIPFILGFVILIFWSWSLKRAVNIKTQLLKDKNSQLENLNADKDLFITILAHDLRSPFNGLLGFLEVLKTNVHEYDIETTRNNINLIYEIAQNTFKILEDTLMWIRANSGKTSFEPQKLNFGAICTNVIENMKEIANAKNITINHDLADDLLIFADKNMLISILRNLVSNSIKFTNRNGRIDIRAEADHTNATVTVSDNGIGMEPEIINILFGISQILSTEGTENEKGSGFGLLICKEFVERHGGKIWVESKAGIGSDFKFTIPLNQG
ncbi:transporter substrate-binding domain-containing protein [Natronoflexus pectinivorans]|uniref:histidine kinase n=1 Tax=Natronoflexus pectinivorans TaxID=682526 RepID=A0A4R2GJG5_9BACT|nr:transporter substrate-binding domain-containing protein [Natronoflexus pectinivorans]TCO08462.1 signal transduction histidine kinase [Natronoflexus pectinivorans]